MGRLYRSAHELIFVLKKGDAPVLNNIGLGKHGRDRTNVWEYPGANRKGYSANEQLGEHATPKAVELVADALLDVTKRGDIVIDPFCGSGTTVIAAEKAGRTAKSLGGAITGTGGNILILDDPLNAGSVASEAERRAVYEKYSNVLPSRFDDPKLGPWPSSPNVCTSRTYPAVCLPKVAGIISISP